MEQGADRSEQGANQSDQGPSGSASGLGVGIGISIGIGVGIGVGIGIGIGIASASRSAGDQVGYCRTTMKISLSLALLASAALASACVSSSSGSSDAQPASDGASDSTADAPAAGDLADVVAVEASGPGNDYTFSVTIRSPDRGCEQYADWWEVITPDGRLLYRRILAHSHVDEQPFTRSGGPVATGAYEDVIVRAHMHPGGYGGTALRGTVAAGFVVDDDGATLAVELAEAEPQPDGCQF